MNKYNELKKTNKENFEIKQKDILNETQQNLKHLQQETQTKKEKVNNKSKVNSGGSMDDINYLLDVDYKNKNKIITDKKNEDLKKSKELYDKNNYNIFAAEKKSKKDPLTIAFSMVSKII